MGRGPKPGLASPRAAPAQLGARVDDPSDSQRPPFGAKAESSGEGRASLSRRVPLQPRMMGQKTLGLCLLGPEAVALALIPVGPA